MPHIIQQNVKQLMMSNCFCQYIAAVTNFDVIQSDIALQKQIQYNLQ